MKFISLFSGIGGFDLGFERAGMTCVAQVENNAHANTILTRQFPHVERFEDVTHVGRSNLPDADVICGGFPCQDVSVAGRRAGLAGERSGLWFEFLRILTETQPRWCVIENVPGLLSSNGGKDFAVILRGLVECRYGVVWRILDAQYFGVAQRRRRVFVVGSLGSGRAATILHHSYREFLPSSQERVVSPTLTHQGTVDSGGGGWTHGIVIVDEHGYRNLTPSEQERLQGFPVNWTSGQDNDLRRKQLGNAVCVNVAEWLGRRLMEVS